MEPESHVGHSTGVHVNAYALNGVLEVAHSKTGVTTQAGSLLPAGTDW